MRRHIAAALLAVLAAPLFAQEKPPEPQIAVQLQPLAVWLGQVQHVTKDYPLELRKPLEVLLADGVLKDFLAAVDVMKPLGCSVYLRDKFEETELVGFVPIKDEKAVLKLLEKLGAESSGTRRAV